jgi:hypothetical protein
VLVSSILEGIIGAVLVMVYVPSLNAAISLASLGVLVVIANGETMPPVAAMMLGVMEMTTMIRTMLLVVRNVERLLPNSCLLQKIGRKERSPYQTNCCRKQQLPRQLKSMYDPFLLSGVLNLVVR